MPIAGAFLVVGAISWFWLPGVARAAEVVVGQVAPMSGLESNQGRAYAVGMQLYFSRLNKAGGLNGHTFKLVRDDDGGRPDETVAKTRQMIQHAKPIVLAGYVGGENIDALLNAGLLEKERIALVGYRVADMQRSAAHLYSVRAGVRDEIRKIIEHLSTIGITRLGLFYEAGSKSEALITASEEAAKRANAILEVRASYVPNSVIVSGAVDAFIKHPPQAIIIVSSGAAAAGFIEMYRAAGGRAQMFAHSGVDVEQLSKRLDEDQMQGVAIAQVTPSPYKISSLITKEFSDAVAAAEKLEVPVSYAMMEGYITARVIAEAIRRQGGIPTRAGTMEALNRMEDFDLGGYLINFKLGGGTGSRYVDLSIISGGRRLRQ